MQSRVSAQATEQCHLANLIILISSAFPVLTMSGVDEPSRAPKTLCTFDSPEALQQYATGCDADVGGTSTMQLSLDDSTLKPTGKLWGDLKLAVRPEFKGRVLGGYAGFRTMVCARNRTVQLAVPCSYTFQFRKNLFGEMMHDLSNHDYLALRVRMRGSKRLKNSYFVNLQTEGYVTTDLWQHRLYFGRDDGDWEDVYVSYKHHCDGPLTNQRGRFLYPPLSSQIMARLSTRKWIYLGSV